MKLLLLLSILFQVSAPARADNKSLFVIRSADADVLEYQTYLQTSGFLSLLDYLKWEGENSAPKSEKLNLAIETSFDNPVLSLPLFDEALEEMSQHPWGEPLRELQLMTFEKIATLKVPVEILNRIKKQIEFLRNPPSTKNRILEIEVRALLKRLNLNSEFLILVNGQPIDHLQFKENLKFHFAVISNFTKPIFFWGTWQNFQTNLTKTKIEQPLANGSCESQKNDQRPLELQPATSIFWGKECVAGLSENDWDKATPQHLTKMDREPKKPTAWLWAAAVLGGVAFYSLKDSEVVVEWPSLSF